MIVDIYQQFITLEKGNISPYPQLVEKKEKWKKKQQQQKKTKLYIWSGKCLPFKA